MVMKSRKIVSALLAFVLAFANMPALQAAKGESEIWVNLLAQDMDTQFAGGTSPFTLENSANGGSQKIVQIDGKNAVEFRDSSVNNENQGGYFYYQLASGALVSRINQVYALPVGSAPVEFVLEYKLKRTAASDKPINNDIYARVQFGNYDNVLIPRFPVPDKSTITNTAAYKNAAPNEMLTVNDSDIASYRMTIVPNGGQRLISTFKLEFSVRVNSSGSAMISSRASCASALVSNASTAFHSASLAAATLFPSMAVRSQAGISSGNASSSCFSSPAPPR